VSLSIAVGKAALHLMRIVEEVWNVLIGAILLAEDVGRSAIAIAEALAGKATVELIIDHVIVDLRRRAEAGAVDGRQRLLLGARAGQLTRLAGRGVVGEFRPQRRALARVEAEAGRLFRAVVQPVVEEAVEQRPQLRIGGVGAGLSHNGRHHGGSRHGSAGEEKGATIHGFALCLLSDVSVLTRRGRGCKSGRFGRVDTNENDLH
jgi:hypothetical protein